MENCYWNVFYEKEKGSRFVFKVTRVWWWVKRCVDYQGQRSEDLSIPGLLVKLFLYLTRCGSPVRRALMLVESSRNLVGSVSR